MKNLLIIGLLFSNFAMAESSMYNEVMQEIQAKREAYSEAQSQAAQRQQTQIREQRSGVVPPTVIRNQKRDEEILSANRIYKRNVADAEKKALANEQRNQQANYLNCMNERVLETRTTLADLVAFDAQNGFSPCAQ